MIEVFSSTVGNELMTFSDFRFVCGRQVRYLINVLEHALSPLFANSLVVICLHHLANVLGHKHDNFQE